MMSKYIIRIDMIIETANPTIDESDAPKIGSYTRALLSILGNDKQKGYNVFQEVDPAVEYEYVLSDAIGSNIKDRYWYFTIYDIETNEFSTIPALHQDMKTGVINITDELSNILDDLENAKWEPEIGIIIPGMTRLYFRSDHKDRSILRCDRVITYYGKENKKKAEKVASDKIDNYFDIVQSCSWSKCNKIRYRVGDVCVYYSGAMLLSTCDTALVVTKDVLVTMDIAGNFRYYGPKTREYMCTERYIEITDAEEDRMIQPEIDDETYGMDRIVCYNCRGVSTQLARVYITGMDDNMQYRRERWSVLKDMAGIYSYLLEIGKYTEDKENYITVTEPSYIIDDYGHIYIKDRNCVIEKMYINGTARADLVNSCAAINELIFGPDVKYIDSAAFMLQRKIGRVVLGTGVQEIGRYAFTHHISRLNWSSGQKILADKYAFTLEILEKAKQTGRFIEKDDGSYVLYKETKSGGKQSW